jgi:hypothetical protein
MNDFFSTGNILTLTGMFLAIAIAIWQYLEASKAKSELKSFFKSLPDELVKSVQSYLSEVVRGEDGLAEIVSQDFQFSAKYADLDGDGQDELLIQMPYGAHGSQVKVFGLRDWEFKLIAELEVSAPSDFSVRDIDHDGRLEVTAIDVADTDFPYVSGFRDEVTFRLENDKFLELGRKPLYEQRELVQGHLDEAES